MRIIKLVTLREQIGNHLLDVCLVPQVPGGTTPQRLFKLHPFAFSATIFFLRQTKVS
ncbi:hypothetical protein D3C85_1935620 [compost metagenome]